MPTTQRDHSIISEVFSKYIFHSRINRAMLIPVLCMMIIAKYTEVLCARQTESISRMIRSGETRISILSSYSFIYVLSIILVEIQAFFICKTGQVGYRNASKDTLGVFLTLPPEQFKKFGLGEIQNIVQRRGQSVQDLIDVFTLNFIPTLLTVLFVSYEVFMGLGIHIVIIINCSVIAYMFLTIRITEWRNTMRKRLNLAQNRASNTMVDGLCNFETVFAYGCSDHEIGKYNGSLRHVEKHSTELARSMYLLNLSQKGLWCLMSIVILFVSCYGRSEVISIEKFTFLLYITGITMKALDNFGFMFGKYRAALVNIKIAQLDTQTQKDGYRTVLRLNEGICAANLCITRDGKSIIKDASFRVNKNEKVAIIGENGSGKSTLLKALIRLGDYEGVILVDSVKHRDLTDMSLKELMTYIPQSTALFDDTVMANIKYGNHKIFDEEVYRASKDLGIHESIEKLQNGYMTAVGEQGKLLSGGERQKILILRAVLRQTPVLLMDEATANLDKQSEQKIIETIVKNPDLTLFSIVHNVELLSMFDRVLVIRDGQIQDR